MSEGQTSLEKGNSEEISKLISNSLQLFILLKEVRDVVLDKALRKPQDFCIHTFGIHEVFGFVNPPDKFLLGSKAAGWLQVIVRIMPDWHGSLI